MRLSYDPNDRPAFTPHPAGVTSAVCVDVIDLGLQPTAFGEKHQLQLVYETPERTDDGTRPMTVRSRRFTATLNEKGNLRKFLNQWRGRDLTEEEALDFDTEVLIGVPCMLSIIHEPKAGDPKTIYANIGSIMPLAKGMPALKPSREYVRVKDRSPEDQAKITARREVPETPRDTTGAKMQEALTGDFPDYPLTGDALKRDAMRALDAIAETEDELPF